MILVIKMRESINEQHATKICARNPPRGAPRVLKGSPAFAKPPLGYKIVIFGARRLKFGLQAVKKKRMICMLERFHPLGALGPLRGSP